MAKKIAKLTIECSLLVARRLGRLGMFAGPVVRQLRYDLLSRRQLCRQSLISRAIARSATTSRTAATLGATSPRVALIGSSTRVEGRS